MSEMYKWFAQPLPKQEIDTYLNMNNIIIEKTELFMDIFLSLHQIIVDTYLGDFEYTETSLEYNDTDITNHFDWCWNKLLSDFEQEGVLINPNGEHKEYLKILFHDSFYRQKSEVVRSSITDFFRSVFNLKSNFTKADLDVLYEIYKMMDKNTEFDEKTILEKC